MSKSPPPILDNKTPTAPSVFQPAALLREARRQKQLATADVPAVCILDPDGDLVRRLTGTGAAARSDTWPCYHTTLHTFTLAGRSVGIIGHTVGAPFAVLVAEELFACGCRLLLNITSAGQIVTNGPPPYFVIIDRALRDEGTSYHYAEAADYAEADPQLVAAAREALRSRGICRCSSAKAGRLTRRFARRKPRSPRREPAISWRSRWRPRRSTPSRARPARACSAWRM